MVKVADQVLKRTHITKLFNIFKTVIEPITTDYLVLSLQLMQYLYLVRLINFRSFLILFLSSLFQLSYGNNVAYGHTTQIDHNNFLFSNVLTNLYTQSLPTYVIVIDAGHGGTDHGCSNTHEHKEKNITLPFAMTLGNKLQHLDANIQIIYTRNGDNYVSLDRRVGLANAANADLFISIHANAIASDTISGFEAYVFGESLDDSIHATEDDSDPISHILKNLNKNNNQSRSADIANDILKQVTVIQNYNSRGVKQRDFRVLKNTNMPSILLELGYLTNQSDAAYIKSKAGQELLATQVAKGIISARRR